VIKLGVYQEQRVALGDISLGSVVVASPDQVSSELAGEVVILDVNRGVYHGLDPTGARIWKLVQERRKVSDVRDAILSEYNVEPERCERDLLALLRQLAEHGLVEVTNG
jgi:hypothetical protein